MALLIWRPNGADPGMTPDRVLPYLGYSAPNPGNAAS